MIVYFEKSQKSLASKIVSIFIAVCFLLSSIAPSYAQSLSALPVPGTIVSPTPGFFPVLVRALEINPENPLQFGFIVDNGDTEFQGEDLTEEAKKLIRYFLACLTTPEEDMWVNLSPYEENRIVSDNLGKTQMGRDLLAQDYILKQLTASLIYPEDELGKKFWDKIYKTVYEKFGTTDIPLNTFNKVWIVPKTAKVYEHDNRVFVIDSKLEVMMEEDFLALSRSREMLKVKSEAHDSRFTSDASQNKLASDIVREILIPEIEKEVNSGKNFANLRQIYNAMILAAWYKNNLKESLLGQIYVDQGKTKGIEIKDTDATQKIYDQYIESFKKGVYDYIKVEHDAQTGKNIPRKYFSGGATAFSSSGIPLRGMLENVIPARSAMDPNGVSGLDNDFKKFDVGLGEIGAVEGVAASAIGVDQVQKVTEKAIGLFFRSNQEKGIELSISLVAGGKSLAEEYDTNNASIDFDSVADYIEKVLRNVKRNELIKIGLGFTVNKALEFTEIQIDSNGIIKIVEASGNIKKQLQEVVTDLNRDADLATIEKWNFDEDEQTAASAIRSKDFIREMVGIITAVEKKKNESANGITIYTEVPGLSLSFLDVWDFEKNALEKITEKLGDNVRQVTSVVVNFPSGNGIVGVEGGKYVARGRSLNEKDNVRNGIVDSFEKAIKDVIPNRAQQFTSSSLSAAEVNGLVFKTEGVIFGKMDQAISETTSILENEGFSVIGEPQKRNMDFKLTVNRSDYGKNIVTFYNLEEAGWMCTGVEPIVSSSIPAVKSQDVVDKIKSVMDLAKKENLTLKWIEMKYNEEEKESRFFLASNMEEFIDKVKADKAENNFDAIYKGGVTIKAYDSNWKDRTVNLRFKDGQMVLDGDSSIIPIASSGILLDEINQKAGKQIPESLNAKDAQARVLEILGRFEAVEPEGNAFEIRGNLEYARFEIVDGFWQAITAEDFGSISSSIAAEADQFLGKRFIITKAMMDKILAVVDPDGVTLKRVVENIGGELMYESYTIKNLRHFLSDVWVYHYDDGDKTYVDPKTMQLVVKDGESYTTYVLSYENFVQLIFVLANNDNILKNRFLRRIREISEKTLKAPKDVAISSSILSVDNFKNDIISIIEAATLDLSKVHRIYISSKGNGPGWNFLSVDEFKKAMAKDFSGVGNVLSLMSSLDVGLPYGKSIFIQLSENENRYLASYNGRKMSGDQATQEELNKKVQDLNNPLLLPATEIKIKEYLDKQVDDKKITEEIYRKALKNTFKNLKEWVSDPDILRLSPNTAKAIYQAIRDERWPEIVEAFRQEITFGTAGIRGKAALTYKELLLLKEDGPDAAILKGPNTINDIVLLVKTAGVVNYMKDNDLHKVIIGYDSRINGKEYAEMIARTFIGDANSSGYDFKIYLFDEASPFPELTFGITTKLVRADVGLLISASHNPADYNGYKITRFNGAQLNQATKEKVLDGVKKVLTANIVLANSIADAQPGSFVWLGGKEPLEGKDYFDFPLKDMHTLYSNQLRSFFVRPEIVKQYGEDVTIGFSAFNGAGYKAVPRILDETGFPKHQVISELQKLNGLFPAFGRGEQPDPGDPNSADIAVNEFVAEHGQDNFDKLDLLLGTDPDADRMGPVVRVPENQQKYFGKYRLLAANDAWPLILWYRLMSKKEKGLLENPENHYVLFSHVTSDALEAVANLFGVLSLGEMMDKTGKEERGGYLNGRRTWVGFTYIADIADKLREKGLINEIGAEESNGMSILGGRVANGEVLGEGAHVNDKDGTLAAVLMAEVAAYCKQQGVTVFELLDKIYLLIGHYATANKPLPRVGSFEGAEGVTEKINLLEEVQQNWMKRANTKGLDFTIAGKRVIGAVEFKSGRYDAQHYQGFPDEGVRFFFEDANLKDGDDFTKSKNFITIRPSGTSQTLRFYTQIFSKVTGEGEALAKQKYDNYHTAELVSLEAQKQLLESIGLNKYLPMVQAQFDTVEENHQRILSSASSGITGDLPEGGLDIGALINKIEHRIGEEISIFTLDNQFYTRLEMYNLVGQYLDDQQSLVVVFGSSERGGERKEATITRKESKIEIKESNFGQKVFVGNEDNQKFVEIVAQVIEKMADQEASSTIKVDFPAGTFDIGKFIIEIQKERGIDIWEFKIDEKSYFNTKITEFKKVFLKEGQTLFLDFWSPGSGDSIHNSKGLFVKQENSQVVIKALKPVGISGGNNYETDQPLLNDAVFVVQQMVSASSGIAINFPAGMLDVGKFILGIQGESKSEINFQRIKIDDVEHAKIKLLHQNLFLQDGQTLILEFYEKFSSRTEKITLKQETDEINISAEKLLPRQAENGSVFGDAPELVNLTAGVIKRMKSEEPKIVLENSREFAGGQTLVSRYYPKRGEKGTTVHVFGVSGHVDWTFEEPGNTINISSLQVENRREAWFKNRKTSSGIIGSRKGPGEDKNRIVQPASPDLPQEHRMVNGDSNQIVEPANPTLPLEHRTALADSRWDFENGESVGEKDSGKMSSSLTLSKENFFNVVRIFEEMALEDGYAVMSIKSMKGKDELGEYVRYEDFVSDELMGLIDEDDALNDVDSVQINFKNNENKKEEVIVSFHPSASNGIRVIIKPTGIKKEVGIASLESFGSFTDLSYILKHDKQSVVDTHEQAMNSKISSGIEAKAGTMKVFALINAIEKVTGLDVGIFSIERPNKRINRIPGQRKDRIGQKDLLGENERLVLEFATDPKSKILDGLVTISQESDQAVVEVKGFDQDVQGEIVNAVETLAASSTVVGGINLDSGLLDLQIERDGNGIPLPFSQQPIEVMNIQGFSFYIMSITNIPSILNISGLVPNNQDERTVSAESAFEQALVEKKFRFVADDPRRICA